MPTRDNIDLQIFAILDRKILKGMTNEKKKPIALKYYSCCHENPVNNINERNN